MKKETDINIDALLRDTFLTVVELRQGTTVRHGMELYRHCQRQVELVRERLKATLPEPEMQTVFPLNESLRVASISCAK